MMTMNANTELNFRATEENAATEAKESKFVDLTTLSEEQIQFLQTQIEAAMEVQRNLDIYRGSMRDVKALVKGELNIPTKQFNQLFKMRREDCRDEIEEENEKVIELYDRMYKD